MTTPQIQPGSPEWLRIITPSKIAAILGKSRFESPYRLWHRMAGNLPPDPPNDRFTAGHAMEHALAYIYKQEHPEWQLSPGEVQIHGDTDALGFRALATVDRRASRGRYRRVVEFKTARSLEDWGDQFTDEVPLDYYLQVQAQQLITGWTQHPAHLMVMGPFFQWHTYEIPHDPQVAEKIVEAARAWQASLDAGTPPPLDDTTATYYAVRDLHPDIEDRDVELDPATAHAYLSAADALDEAKRAEREAKTRLLDQMGKAAKAHAAGAQVATRYQHGQSVRLRRNRNALKQMQETAA